MDRKVADFNGSGSIRSQGEVPELRALRRLRSKSATQKATAREIQEALAPYWKAWREEPKKATVVLRRLAEEKVSLALLVLDCMKHSTVETNILHWNPVIFELSKTHEWQHSVELLLSVMRSHVPPDIQSFSSICNAASRADAWLLALRVLQDMPRMQVQPNERIYNIVASCCSSHWQIAKTLLDDMMISGILPDAISFSTVAACSPSAMTWCITLGLLEMGEQQKVEMDVTNYGATINGLGDAHWPEALALLMAMSQRTLEMKLPAFNAAMGVAAETQWSKVMGLLKELGLPNHLSFSAAFSALGRVQRWRSSLELTADLFLIR